MPLRVPLAHFLFRSYTTNGSKDLSASFDHTEEYPIPNAHSRTTARLRSLFQIFPKLVRLVPKKSFIPKGKRRKE